MAAWTLPAMILDWCEFVTTALDRRSRKYFFNIILGMILSCGRRTVSCWLRSGDVSEDWQDHYYFLQTLGRSAKRVATQLLHLAVRHIPVSHAGEFAKLAIDDSPTKCYGKEVELAGKHHNRKRPTNPFLSGSVVWSPVSSGFQISPDEVVHERVGSVVV
jgi:hypothetical protein